MTDERDRDPTGRPRSARARDVTGRPLPRGAAGEPEWAGEVPPAPAAPAAAQALIDAGRPFAAHELLEAVWKTAPTPERELWRGLAQVAVALTHLQRGNQAGASALLRRAAANLRPYGAAARHGVQPAALADRAERAADLVAAGGGLDTAAVRLLPGSGGG